MKTNTLVRLFLFLGILLAAYGHLAWVGSKNAEANKVFCLIALVPGWSLIVMGWIGVMADRVVGRLDASRRDP